MKKRNGSAGRLLLCVLPVMCATVWAGCNIHMTASERVGNAGGTDGEAETVQTDAGVTELPVITVAYEPYDMYALAEWAYGMGREEVDERNLSEYENSLYLTPRDDSFANGNTGIGVFTAKYGMNIRWEDGAANYSSTIVQNACTDARQQGSYQNYEYAIEPSWMALAFPATKDKMELYEEAVEAVTRKLQELGLSPALCYGGVADQEFWDSYLESHYHRNDFEPEENICFLVFEQECQGALVESPYGFGLIYAAYSSERESLLMLEADSPVYGEVLTAETKTLLSKADAMLLGKNCLKKQYGIGSAALKDASLVYVLDFGAFDSEAMTVTMYPAWKINFEVTAGEETVEDYILLNAENGIQITNTSQLY